MGLLDFLKKKPEEGGGKHHAPTMNGNIPFYTEFGNDIYASDIVVQSIRCKANEFKKLQPRHIVTKDGRRTVDTESSIAKCLRRPNEYMSTADFLEKSLIFLELNKNSFIYPQYFLNNANKKIFTGIYPLKPQSVEYLVDKSGRYFIHLSFANGYESTLPANEVVHWRKDFFDDYFGGNSLGGNTGLMKALKEYDRLTQSIAKAVECSCQINGVMKINTYLEDEKMEKQREEFEKKLLNNESGILFTDMKSEYTHMKKDVKLVDAETLKFFYETITRANGVSLAILNGDYTKTQKEAFYEHALEADIISLGQAISRCVFSDREEAFGNEIVLYPSVINFMSMENKIELFKTAAPGGYFLKDELRDLMGYPPLPNGQGQVIAQGYNSLLDQNNNNTLSGEGGNDNGKE